MKTSPKLIVSSIGTSLLTQQASQEERSILTQYSNEKVVPDDVTAIIEKLRKTAFQQLTSKSVQHIRRASAELNGIFGLYGNNLTQGAADVHILISTDTAQGLATAEVVRKFLIESNLSADIYTPKNLTTKTKAEFSEGIKDLLTWCYDTLTGYEEGGYEIIFNLTGGFKSLQGFLNTIGMFYADKIVYIFESGEELIQIPRLPVAIDKTILFDNLDKFVLLYEGGKEFVTAEFSNIRESLYDELDGKIYPSLWGNLIWNQVKNKFLSERIIALPRIRYADSFVKDFQNILDKNEKIKLQEVLAKVSVLLDRESGSTRLLKADGGIQYEDFNNKQHKGIPIGHFRITQSVRVSCLAENGELTLRHYGAHDYVNNNP